MKKQIICFTAAFLLIFILAGCNISAPVSTLPTSSPTNGNNPTFNITPTGPIETNASARWEIRSTDITSVMSLNVLTSSKIPIDQIQRSGITRGEAFRFLMEDCMPDSIGLCEVTDQWLGFLESTICAELPYEICGKLSTSGNALKASSGEINPILYRKDKFTVVEEGGYWLSETPDLPSKFGPLISEDGSTTYAGMHYNRTYCYAVFQSIQSGKVAYIHINTHFDHKSDSRVDLLCAQQIKAGADLLQEKYQCPIVITGDFNEREDDLGYLYLADPVNGYANSKYLTSDFSTLTTAGGYGTKYQRGYYHIIDHIFLSLGTGSVVKHDVIELPYLSDHSPVYVELILP